jgi:hypothetical protein
VLVHQYKDGTVDGEIVFPVPRGVTEERLYKTILDAYGQNPGHIGPGYWLSLGQRYTIKEGDEVYRRNRGMNEIMTYYASMTRRGIIAATFGAARDLMTPGAREKYRRKAAMVIVRLHWNPDRVKPER